MFVSLKKSINWCLIIVSEKYFKHPFLLNPYTVQNEMSGMLKSSLNCSCDLYYW